MTTMTLTDLVAAVRRAVDRKEDWARTADLVADRIKAEGDPHLIAAILHAFAVTV